MAETSDPEEKPKSASTDSAENSADISGDRFAFQADRKMRVAVAAARPQLIQDSFSSRMASMAARFPEQASSAVRRASHTVRGLSVVARFRTTSIPNHPAIRRRMARVAKNGAFMSSMPRPSEIAPLAQADF